MVTQIEQEPRSQVEGLSGSSSPSLLCFTGMAAVWADDDEGFRVEGFGVLGFRVQGLGHLRFKAGGSIGPLWEQRVFCSLQPRSPGANRFGFK